jgi:hypothetical protein
VVLKIVRAQGNVPKPGRSDFQNVCTSQVDAIQDILDFYSGKPGRMRAKAEAGKLPIRTAQADTLSSKTLNTILFKQRLKSDLASQCGLAGIGIFGSLQYRGYHFGVEKWRLAIHPQVE